MKILFLIWSSLLIAIASFLYVLPNYGTVSYFVVCLMGGYINGYLVSNLE